LVVVRLTAEAKSHKSDRSFVRVVFIVGRVV
jgi:hypothetical protein